MMPGCCDFVLGKVKGLQKPILGIEREDGEEMGGAIQMWEEFEGAGREEAERENDNNVEEREEEDGISGECRVAGQDNLSPGGAAVESEEGREPVSVKSPITVTKEQRDEHEKTHTPYKDRCKWCVLARCKDSPHAKKNKG